MHTLKSVAVMTLTLGCQLSLGGACAAGTEDPVDVYAGTSPKNEPLVATTVCTGALDADAQGAFNNLQDFEFVRKVYSAHDELSATVTLPGEFGSMTNTQRVGPDSKGKVTNEAVTIAGSFGRYEVGSSRFSGLAEAFRKDGTIANETIRLAFWSADAVTGDGPFVMAFKGESICKHTVE